MNNTPDKYVIVKEKIPAAIVALSDALAALGDVVPSFAPDVTVARDLMARDLNELGKRQQMAAGINTLKELLDRLEGKSL